MHATAHLEAIASAVQARMQPWLPGLVAKVVAEVDSTNSELMRCARDDPPQTQTPRLLVAQRQTGGRGRLGRQWHGQCGQLAFSLGVYLTPPAWDGLSLAVGCAVAESLSETPDHRVLLKWPNDLWLDGCKLGGILVETAGVGEAVGTKGGRYAVIGIGINIVRPVSPDNAADRFRTPPVGLNELLPGVDAHAALLLLAEPLAAAVAAFALAGFAPFQARFNARDALRDRAVVLSDGTQGTAHGVSDSGALLVHTARGMQSVTSAEISVQPALSSNHL